MERNIEALDAWLYYDKEELERLEREDAIEEGIKLGITERNIEIAKNMLSMNLTLEQISQATGLSIADIKNINN